MATLGTVVDKKICCPTEFDFYLCSRAGIQVLLMTSKGGLQPRMFSQFLIDPTGCCLAQGTSRSTHYHVLMDENKFSADGLQMLTHNLYYV